MFKRSSFHTNSCTETFALLINSVIDDALLETTPDIDQELLQFIDVINLLDRFCIFPVSCRQRGSVLCCWVAKGLVK